MSDNNGKVHLTIIDGIAAILIDRPAARNAMTWAMYEQLGAICDQLAADPAVKVATIRGAGGEAFVAGTDIEQFRDFRTADDGVAYEKEIDRRIGQIERLPMPTIAIVEGWVIGGGLAISAACDFRIATPSASFGVPIARTLGNCLSMSNTARVVAAFGVPRAKRMLMLAETIGAEEAKACSFVTEIAEPSELDAAAARMCKRLAGHAPLTMRVSKEAICRLSSEGLPHGEDLIRTAYGSRDFRTGVEAFLAKTRPEWSGT
ncbi:enoyl-CoA hydratase/isomerase family protein [Massilia sp. R2A-15]|uniref:enoyl-CoA hydratase/isomerase family protein n=1 Tax=Massilia sp. R2A-15 TaxID=3064278 RepID=UPI002734CFD8|nr:enoyl-CoA hydratase/isomerase family protein [Massilia sp. R2A-15]WLI91386.1 enoyl-CoA hydratase/isomerase family protein [Massilia sp. R2A-15]